MTIEKAIFWLAVMAISLNSCSKEPKPPDERAAKRESRTPAEDTTSQGARPAAETAQSNEHRGVKTEIRNVMFRLNDKAAVHLELVSGEIWPTRKNQMPVFDDKTSFELRVTNGKISIAPEALADILNEYVFAPSDAPLKDISVSIEEGQLHIKGKLRSKGDLPFETAGTVSATADGRLRVRTEKVKAMHVPVKGVMGLFGIELAKVLNTSKTAGIDTDKNDLVVELETLLPPPHLKGKIKNARIEGNRVVTFFGDGGESIPAPKEPANYMAFQGNELRFGKLTMLDADLTVLDMDPGDPLDWYQDQYQRQVAAGCSKITANFGLRSYAKDYSKLPHQRAAKRTKAENRNSLRP